MGRKKYDSGDVRESGGWEMNSLIDDEKKRISEIIDDFVGDQAEYWSIRQGGGEIYYWYEEARKLRQNSTNEFIIGILLGTLLEKITNYLDLINKQDVKWGSVSWDEIIETLKTRWIEIEDRVTTLQGGEKVNGK